MQLTDMPALNALLNGLASVFLLAGFVFIKKGDRVRHRWCMLGALTMSALFLVSYVTYHVGMQRVHGAAHTKFVDPAWFRPYYLAILLTHLVGAIVIVPLV